MLHYRRVWRGTIVISVANPLLFLAGLGSGLGPLVDGGDRLGGVGYLAFLAPGLLAASAMQTAATESLGRVYMAARGPYVAAAATPLSPVAVLRGHLAFMVFRIATSALAFVLVMWAFGVTGPGRALALVPAATLTGLAFCAPIAAWSVGVTRRQPLDALFRFVIMPLYMFSGTFFVTDDLPDGLRIFIEVTPLWHGIELCRSISVGTATWGSTALHAGYLSVLAAVGVLVAARTYRRRLHA